MNTQQNVPVILPLNLKNAHEIRSRLFNTLNQVTITVEGIYVNGQRFEEGIPMCLEDTELRMSEDMNYAVFPGISIFWNGMEIGIEEYKEPRIRRKEVPEITLLFRGEKWATHPIIANGDQKVSIIFCPDRIEIDCVVQGEPWRYSFQVLSATE